MPSTTTSDGALISWHDLGGRGPDLLMAHATGFCGRIWEAVAERLGRSFHCWSLDLRGHGDSSQPDLETFSWRQFSLDVRAVVEQLGPDRPFGLGHSMGGASLLMTEQRWPGTFRALYLYEPAVYVPDGPLDDDGSGWAEMTRRRRAGFASRQAAWDNFWAKPPMSHFDPAVLASYVRHGLGDQPDGTVRLKCPPETEAAVFLGFRATDVYERLAQVRCPVVVASGGRPPEAAGRPSLAERLPAGRAVELAGLDHYGPFQHPGVLADSVAESFLSSR